jgi:gluconolactonase
MEDVVTPLYMGTGLTLAEGITFEREGTLYCVDVYGGGIWRMLPGGALREWVNTGGGPNGSRFGPNGDLFIGDCVRKAILRCSTATAQETVYAAHCDGRPFRGPNDLCFGPDGTLNFTDPAGFALAERIGAVYAVAPDGRVAPLATDLAFPNGLMVTPDGATLVVAETFTGVLHHYSLDPVRRYRELEPLATLHPAGEGASPTDVVGPDGMAFGADGNLYVAHYGSGYVQVVAPDGAIVTSLPAGGTNPTNVAFWQDSLYVTQGTSGSIYRLDIGVREQPPFMRPW